MSTKVTKLILVLISFSIFSGVLIAGELKSSDKGTDCFVTLAISENNTNKDVTKSVVCQQAHAAWQALLSQVAEELAYLDFSKTRERGESLTQPPYSPISFRAAAGGTLPACRGECTYDVYKVVNFDNIRDAKVMKWSFHTNPSGLTIGTGSKWTDPGEGFVDVEGNPIPSTVEGLLRRVFWSASAGFKPAEKLVEAVMDGFQSNITIKPTIKGCASHCGCDSASLTGKKNTVEFPMHVDVKSAGREQPYDVYFVATIQLEIAEMKGTCEDIVEATVIPNPH